MGYKYVFGTSVLSIRQALHQTPELSGKEEGTAAFIASKLSMVDGMEIYRNVGGHGVVATKNYGHGGSVIAFRAELDALPISEDSDQSYTSRNEGISHACGHDGHMAILFKLVENLEIKKPHRGSLMLIFQPAEETGEGAKKVSEALLNKEIPGLPSADYIFALHNVPGLEKSKVYLKDGAFACASAGIAFAIQGITAHAAHPEEGVNPLEIATILMQDVQALPVKMGDNVLAMATPISLHSGIDSFGTSPADAQLRLTLRAGTTEVLDQMISEAKDLAKLYAKTEGCNIQTQVHEYFPATVNSAFTAQATQAASLAGIGSFPLQSAFRWSEDFAWFSSYCPSYMFALGAGFDCHPLHSPDYDFPDEITEAGASVFTKLFMEFIS